MEVLTDTLCESIMRDDARIIARLASCPYCGGKLRQARSGTRKDTMNPDIIATQYRFQCTKCGANFYSLEQRPVGERPCCTDSLRKSRVRQHSRLWFFAEDKPEILCRELVHSCPTCGRTYTWHEQLTLRGG